MTWREFIAEVEKHPDMLDTEALLYLDDLADVRIGEEVPFAGVLERFDGEDHYREDNNLAAIIWDRWWE